MADFSVFYLVYSWCFIIAQIQGGWMTPHFRDHYTRAVVKNIWLGVLLSDNTDLLQVEFILWRSEKLVQHNARKVRSKSEKMLIWRLRQALPHACQDWRTAWGSRNIWKMKLNKKYCNKVISSQRGGSSHLESHHLRVEVGGIQHYVGHIMSLSLI